MNDFQKELETLLNRYSKENGSDTPDWILARYLQRCLTAFNETLEERERWYGRTVGGSLGKPAIPPTIGELQAILDSNEKLDVQVNRDGSCTAIPSLD